jgi:hypothetical protein
MKLPRVKQSSRKDPAAGALPLVTGSFRINTQKPAHSMNG